jgi:GDP-4-dehydro-6-deoxy-D-mannose reductase
VSATPAGLPLVTGATGFAGSHLVERLRNSHPAVAAWAHSAPVTSSSDEGVHWQTVDLRDRPSIAEALSVVRPSLIYHCAGLPHVAESWSRAAQALQVNAFGTHLLLDTVAAMNIDATVIIVSSALVYRPAAEALTEQHPLAPSDPYGVSKVAQEMAATRSPVRCIIARPFNHAGPRQSAAFVTSSFARQIAEIEAGQAEPVLRVGNLDARRDITDVRDTVRAYEALARGGRPATPYNVCAGHAPRVGDLLEQLLSMAKVRVTVQQDPSRMRPSDNPLVLGDPARITSEIGWRAEIPIAQTLKDLLDWWRARTVAE